MLLRILITITSVVHALPANQNIISNTVAPICDCTGTNNTRPGLFICGDERLGPIFLPTKYPLLDVVSTYNRFGGLQPRDFLEQWWNATAGKWRYPPLNGYLLDDSGVPINGTVTLKVGQKVDRFGYESGTYVSDAETPYDQRSLPPRSLNHGENKNNPTPLYPNNYHVYRVIKPLTVVAGPIAPFYGQPGLGTQFYTKNRTIESLIEEEFLERLDLDKLTPPGAKKGFCD